MIALLLSAASITVEVVSLIRASDELRALRAKTRLARLGSTLPPETVFHITHSDGSAWHISLTPLGALTETSRGEHL